MLADQLLMNANEAGPLFKGQAFSKEIVFVFFYSRLSAFISAHPRSSCCLL